MYNYADYIDGYHSHLIITESDYDSIKHDLSLLRSFQEQEIDYADYIKDKLNIPYIMCNISEEEKIYTFIEDLVSL
ncbi:MAG: hypothetical protein ACLBM3_20860, partial [Dolichospermum sp.]